MRYFLGLIIACLFASCGSGNQVQEETIAGAIKHKYAGSHDDYVIKVLESDDTGTITVGDSIRIIRELFEDERRRELDYARSALAMMEQFVVAVNSNRFSSADEKASAAESVRVHQARLDSLSSAQPVIPDQYSSANQAKVLVRIVKSRFSISEPSTGKELSDTYDFYMSEDHTTVYEMKKSR